MITQSHLKSLFSYSNGSLYWINSNKGLNAGDRAGHLNDIEYTQVRINYKSYLLHRLIYLYHHGVLPDLVDHKDGNPKNNRIENLRPCTRSQNNHNSKISKNNSCGVKGVYKIKETGKFRARITVDGKCHSAGVHKDIEQAKIAIEKLRSSLLGEFCNHG